MRTLLIAIIFFLFGANVFSQIDSLDRAFIRNNTNEYIYNHVYKNIAAFHIRFPSHWVDHLRDDNRFRANVNCSCQSLMPDLGYKLKMDIEKLDSVYPNPKFQLYKIYLQNYTWIPDNQNMPVIGGAIPGNSYYFLIALNKNTGDIKFISGEFFTSYISDDFNLNKNDPATLIPYLKMRAFNVGAGDIKLQKKKHKEYIYEGFSEMFKRHFIIRVDRKIADYYQIIVKAK